MVTEERPESQHALHREIPWRTDGSPLLFRKARRQDP